MFGFLLRKKRDDVRTMFAGYVNRNSVQGTCGVQRRSTRGTFSQIVWIVFVDDASGEPAFDDAIPVVTKDISLDGLAVFHTRPVDAERVLIGLEGDVSMQFVNCQVGHCTPMGYGFYQIGLQPVELIDLSPSEANHFFRRRRQFEREATDTEVAAKPMKN